MNPAGIAAMEEEVIAGAPAWMATFADLMSLLMCFFVLLLSFSEMDILKYKQIAGSMASAFGVQRDVPAPGIPMGTSFIAQEFSPGRPDPTPLNEVRQHSTDIDLRTLDVLDTDPGTNPERSISELNPSETKELLEETLAELIQETKAEADALEKLLSEEIIEGLVDIESGGRSITIRIREKGSFDSASAILNPDFIPVMAKIRVALSAVEGDIAVEGHTDNIPIQTAQFRSNWDLSASRALSVAHELLVFDDLDESRFLVVGHADIQPYKDNDSVENRAANRRVEIIIRQGLDAGTSASLAEIQQSNSNIISTLSQGEPAPEA